MKSCFEAIAALDDLGKLAKEFILHFPDGGVFLLPSEMGSGKTTFCRCVLESLGYEFEGSPSFAIAHQYSALQKPTVLHVDLYRVKRTEELIEMGFGEMLTTAHYVFIEWPEKSKEFIQLKCYLTTIEFLSGGKRKYKITESK